MNFKLIKTKINCRELLVKLKVIGEHNYYETISCPFVDHEDYNPSFYFLNDDQYFHCFGCERKGDVIQLYSEMKDIPQEQAAREIAEMIGLECNEEVKHHAYMDQEGNFLFECVRNPNKTFFFRRMENGEWVNNLQGIQPVLYRLEKWCKRDCPIIIVEGEKDVETLENLFPEYGITTNPFGAGRWRKEYSESLRGRKVFIIPDNDKPGFKHANKVAESLSGIADEVRIVSLTGADEVGEDASRYIEKYGEQKGVELITKAMAESRLFEKAVIVDEHPEIALPRKNRLASEFIGEVIEAMVQSKRFFRYGEAVLFLTDSGHFHTENPESFISSCEKFITTGNYVKNPDFSQDKNLAEYLFEPNSMSERDAKRILKCHMIKKLPEIKGFLDIPMPLVVNGKMELTQAGYCENTGYWTINNDVEIELMDLGEAREIIFDIFSEFCFLEEEVDRSLAIAYLFTPALKMLIKGQRAPIFLADGNREGVGKDYLLGVSPLLYTGKYPSYLPPCSADDEWRKRLHSACLNGESFLLISNLKGHLSSSSLEAASTSLLYSDRTLGKSKFESLPNTAIYCFSGNGVTFSSDLERRYLRIRLEWYKEDIQKRRFKRDLYEHILENRNRILSAVYTCIDCWVEAGMPNGRGCMPSFVNWAKIVSGIMQECGLGNPFQERSKLTPSMLTGGDLQIHDMKTLIKLWSERYGEEEVKAEEIRALSSSNNLFNWIKLDEISGKTKFSKMLISYSDRIFAGYKLSVDTEHKQARFRLVCAEPQQKTKDNIGEKIS